MSGAVAAAGRWGPLCVVLATETFRDVTSGTEPPAERSASAPGAA